MMVHVELLFSGLSKHQDWYPCPDKYKSHTGDHYLRVSTSQHTSTGDSTRQPTAISTYPARLRLRSPAELRCGVYIRFASASIHTTHVLPMVIALVSMECYRHAAKPPAVTENLRVYI